VRCTKLPASSGRIFSLPSSEQCVGSHIMLFQKDVHYQHDKEDQDFVLKHSQDGDS
jgi:hypothetical protein